MGYAVSESRHSRLAVFFLPHSSCSANRRTKRKSFGKRNKVGRLGAGFPGANCQRLAVIYLLCVSMTGASNAGDAGSVALQQIATVNRFSQYGIPGSVK